MATISAAMAIAIEHHRAGRLAAAAQIYRQILQAEPEQADAWHLQGVIAHQIRQHAAAVDCIGRAIAANPHVAEYHNNLGVALRELGRIDEAAACYRRAVELNPDYAEAHNNLGNVLKNQGDFAGAAAGFQRALQLSPDYAEAHSNLATLIKDQGQPDESLAGYRRAAELRPDAAEIGSNLLYALQYCPGYTAQDIYAEHCRWSRRHAQPPAGFVQPHGNDRSPGRRLRVGYVSPDFREHCLAQVAGPLLAAHDHQNFEIFCYADVTCPDQATARLRGCADVWRDIVGLTAQQGAALVREDRIDVLVDLTMHMAHNHLLLFAHKPAPVQVCWAPPACRRSTTGSPIPTWTRRA
jgi:predicted O-linked N-acetylglucosamine transferase (SPINDLY family)